ncbi:aminopeptidase N-like isoform X1 [Pecten maximus]|uniref:aminopeptidase N-like isoform X1 n=1 Tax=Pecten maximus TaxID=6579 RepID=UPI001458269E|nr:aminopeptidase N-like isoform X1 [Pecten maximus]
MAPSVTTEAPSKTIDVRLPTSLKPELYTVELQPNMYEGDPTAFTFDGSVNIRMECTQPTRNITVHINLLNITDGSIMVSAEDTTEPALSMTRFELDTERQFLIVHVNRDLTPTKFYNLALRFVGPLKDDLHGLYLSSYKRGNNSVYIATTQFQPTDARKSFPCFDEPGIKARFDIVLVRKSHMVSLSNMPIKTTETRDNGWIADVFETTPAMSTYLLAFIVSDFQKTSNTTKNNVLYGTYARPEAINQTYYALKTGTEILTYFEDYFNISFPLPKQDMIALPDFAAGAMENWGLITYRETAMLYDPLESSEVNKQRVAVVVSHELAHQWFGNLVTPSWWDDLWLNEGFASFVEYMGVDFVHPDWKMFDQFVVEDIQSVFNFDGLVTSHPVYVPVSHPDEINEIFDRISYGKGASIIRMMRFFLGEDTFKRGLTTYLSSLAYGAAFHDDLWFALGNQSIKENKPRSDVKEIMDTWTLQMNFPLVTVTKNGATGLKATQKRYLRDYNAVDPGTYPSPYNYRWEIPFTYTTSSSPMFYQTDADVKWMRKDSDTIYIANAISSSDTWVIANVKQYGYYRVNYDSDNWAALVDQLKTDPLVIDPVNRAQIINDAWNLAKSGDLPIETALSTVEYLDKEPEYIVWDSAIGELGYVKSMLERTELYGPFSKFMKHKVREPFTKITLNNTGATHLESYLRATLASQACGYGIDQCVLESKQLFASWLQNPNAPNPIDASLRGTVYCTAIAHGGVEEWDFAYRMFKASNVAGEQGRLMAALACSKETWILSRYLVYSITPDKIRKQDATSVIVYISNNPIGRALAWDFVRGHWDFLMNEYGGGSFSFSRLLSGLSSKFNTDFEIAQLNDFLEKNPDMGSGTRAFKQAIEKTNSNVKWMNENYGKVETWLRDQGY